jgi:hypothetical protein
MAEYEGLKSWVDNRGAYFLNKINGNNASIDIYLNEHSVQDQATDPDIQIKITEQKNRWVCTSMEIKSMWSEKTNTFVLGLFKHQDELSAAETVIPVIRQLLK